MLTTHDDYLAAIEKVTAAATAYYNGDAPVMTDDDYDQLFEQVSVYAAENPQHADAAATILGQVAAGTVGAGDIHHDTPMLSLDKVKTLEEVTAFEERVAALGGTVMLEPKLDGIAVHVEYRDGRLTTVATRGDGRTGEDITARVAALDRTGLPETINWPGVVQLRGEIVMSREDFTVSNRNRVEAGNPPFANPRNATAGTVRKESPGYRSQVTFVTHEAFGFSNHRLMSLGLVPVGLVWGGDFPADTLIARVEAFGVARTGDDFDYPTDGVVIKVVEPQVRAELGETSRAPRWAVAFKYDAERAQTTIRDIEVGVGRTGNISFTAVFDPVTVDGSTVARATLHNPAFIADNDIRIGSFVEVFKANDIIPRVVKVLAQPEGTVSYVPPTVSPSGAPLDMSEAIWRSTDPADSLGAWIAYAASRDALDIDGLSTAIADSLVDHGLVEDVADLFTLTVDVLAALPTGGERYEESTSAMWPEAYPGDGGMASNLSTVNGRRQYLQQSMPGIRRLGEKTATKLVANIHAATQQPLNRVITALGIRKSGRTFGRRLASHFHTLDALTAATEQDFLNSGVEGVGPERAALFYAGFQRLTPVIEKLRAAGVNMGEAPSAVPAPAGALDGMTVVVTGAMTGPLTGLSRNEVNELIEQHGGRASGSVSKTTSLLVCGEEGSSKWKKANELGVTIVTPDEFAAMAGM